MAVGTPPAVDAGPGTVAATPPRPRPRIYYGYYLVGVALVAQFVTAGAQAYVSGVFLGPMTHDLGWTRAQFAAGQSVGSFVMAFAGFFIGTQVDRGRARALMVAGATVFGASLMLTSQITEYWQWIVLRGFSLTLGASMMGNLVVNVVLSKWWVERRGRVVGISSMGVSLAGVILPPVMTRVVDRIGWQNGWIVLGVMSWILIYPAAMMMRTSPEERGLHPDNKTDAEMASNRGDRIRADFANSLTRKQALRTPALYSIVIAFGLSGVGLGTMLQQTIPFATDSGFSRGTAAFMLTLLATPAAFTKPFWGAYMDYVPEKVAAATSFLICTAAIAVILIGAHIHATLVLAVGFFLVGTGIGGQIPIQETIWATYFGRRYLGEVRSVALPFSLFLGAGGPLAVAFYFDRVGNYDGAFIGLATMWALAAWLVLLVRRPAVSGQRPDDTPRPVAPGANGANAAAASAVAASAVRAGLGTSWPPSTPSPGSPVNGARPTASWGFTRGGNGRQPSVPDVRTNPTDAHAKAHLPADYGLGTLQPRDPHETRDYMRDGDKAP
jgi:MFS family permease